MTKLTPSATARAALILLSIGVTPSANAAYTFTNLDTLNGFSGFMSQAFAINNVGQVAGFTVTTGNAAPHATLWNGTTAIDLGTLGGQSSGAFALNDVGQVAGWSDTTMAGTHATLWNGATATDLGTLGGQWSYALGINNAGQVAGISRMSDPSIASHATLWNGGTITDLGVPSGGENSQAWAINNAGQIAGWSGTNTFGNSLEAGMWNGHSLDRMLLTNVHSEARALNNVGQVAGMTYLPNSLNGNFDVFHATLWNSGGSITDLGTLSGATNSEAWAINNVGQVVGTSYIGLNGHATLWNNTTVIDLNSLLDAGTVSAGWVLTEARGINDQGWIVGSAFNSITNETHAFLLSDTANVAAPVPEPEAYAMLLAGLGLVGFTARRRKNRSA